MGKLKMTAKVVSQETLATDVYSLVLEAPDSCTGYSGTVCVCVHS